MFEISKKMWKNFVTQFLSVGVARSLPVLNFYERKTKSNSSNIYKMIQCITKGVNIKGLIKKIPEGSVPINYAIPLLLNFVVKRGKRNIMIVSQKKIDHKNFIPIVPTNPDDNAIQFTPWKKMMKVHYSVGNWLRFKQMHFYMFYKHLQKNSFLLFLVSLNILMFLDSILISIAHENFMINAK